MPTSKPRIRLLVTDLDNTLYDWVSYFATAFDAMVAVATHLLDVPEEALLDDLREVHQRHRNSEQPFALLDTRVVRERFPGLGRLERAQVLGPALTAFDRVREQTLKLYPGVADAIRAVRAAGAAVVGHTEASATNALFRLDSLGIAPLLERLYAVEDSGEGHPDPAQCSALDRSHPPVRLLGPDERKPDVRVLLEICRDHSVLPAETLYIGDSVPRDIGMAKDAGAWAAWAKYGTAFDAALWNRLVRVTHWSAEDVARAERARQQYGTTRPDVVLERGFYEIINQFEFVSP